MIHSDLYWRGVGRETPSQVKKLRDRNVSRSNGSEGCIERGFPSSLTVLEEIQVVQPQGLSKSSPNALCPSLKTVGFGLGQSHWTTQQRNPSNQNTCISSTAYQPSDQWTFESRSFVGSICGLFMLYKQCKRRNLLEVHPLVDHLGRTCFPCCDPPFLRACQSFCEKWWGRQLVAHGGV